MTPAQARVMVKELLDALKSGELSAKANLEELSKKVHEMTTQDPTQIQDLIWLRTRLPKEIEKAYRTCRTVSVRPRNEKPLRETDVDDMRGLISMAKALHMVLKPGKAATGQEALKGCLLYLENHLREALPEMFETNKEESSNVTPIRRSNLN